MRKPTRLLGVLSCSIPLALACLAASCSKHDPKAAASNPASAYAGNTNDPAQARLAWNLHTLVDPYELAGFKGRKWDAAARRALTEFAKVRSDSKFTAQSLSIVVTNSESAIAAGCRDPMVRYLYVRFSPKEANVEQQTKDLVEVAQAMDKTTYPAIRRFYASMRAMDQARDVYGTNLPPDIETFFRQNSAGETFRAVTTDVRVPGEEVYQACHEMFSRMQADPQHYSTWYQLTEPEVLRNWKNEPAIWLWKGECYIDMAWQARGGGYADTVTRENMNLFKDRLDTADKALTRAWELNPNDVRIAVKMLWLELGQGQGRERMEQWFQSAMTLDPNSYDAANNKLLYLEPKWYGSVEEMLKFGRECAQNTNWGGHVPLVLLNAHVDIVNQFDKAGDAYWKRPEVWKDVSDAFERFFLLNPNETSWRHNYAWYAYHAEQWDKLNELLPQLGSVNYDFFGGKDEYDKMVRLAKEHARKP